MEGISARWNEVLQLVGDDEGHYVIVQALLEHNETPYPAVAVLKRVYGFEPLVEIKNVIEGNRFLGPGAGLFASKPMLSCVPQVSSRTMTFPIRACQ